MAYPDKSPVCEGFESKCKALVSIKHGLPQTRVPYVKDLRVSIKHCLVLTRICMWSIWRVSIKHDLFQTRVPYVKDLKSKCKALSSPDKPSASNMLTSSKCPGQICCTTIIYRNSEPVLNIRTLNILHLFIKGPSLSWSYGCWIYNYLCNQCLSPLKLWVRTTFMARCTR